MHDDTGWASLRRGDPRRREVVSSGRAAPPMTRVHTHSPSGNRSMLVPVLWGLVVGVIQAASPLAVRWLDAATVYALELALIAAVYIGFAVADGRPRVIAVECAVAGLFILLAATAVTRDGMAARARLHRPRAQGRLAGTPPVRHQHTMVAPVLRRRRLARRRHPGHRDHRRNPRPLGSAVPAGRRGATWRATRRRPWASGGPPRDLPADAEAKLPRGNNCHATTRPRPQQSWATERARTSTALRLLVLTTWQ